MIVIFTSALDPLLQEMIADKDQDMYDFVFRLTHSRNPTVRLQALKELEERWQDSMNP